MKKERIQDVCNNVAAYTMLIAIITLVLYIIVRLPYNPESMYQHSVLFTTFNLVLICAVVFFITWKVFNNTLNKKA
jgi:hypothetical protein